jgi:hypothetical protein
MSKHWDYMRRAATHDMRASYSGATNGILSRGMQSLAGLAAEQAPESSPSRLLDRGLTVIAIEPDDVMLPYPTHHRPCGDMGQGRLTNRNFQSLARHTVFPPPYKCYPIMGIFMCFALRDWMIVG